MGSVGQCFANVGFSYRGGASEISDGAGDFYRPHIGPSRDIQALGGGVQKALRSTCYLRMLLDVGVGHLGIEFA